MQENKLVLGDTQQNPLSIIYYDVAQQLCRISLKYFLWLLCPLQESIVS
jgi:hypothetical protein